MNKKWLEIYKKYRERTYIRDLEKLRNNPINRGIAHSNDERWLKEDYKDEVEMKEAEIGVHEEQLIKGRISIITTIILAIVGVGSFIATVYYANLNFRHQYRPYLGAAAILLSENTPGEIEIQTTLKNSGSMPANNIRIKTYTYIDGEFLDEYPGLEDKESYPTYLMPEPNYGVYTLQSNVKGLDRLKSKDHEWIIKMEITYDGVKTKNHKTIFRAKYLPHKNSFESIDGFAN